MVVDVSFKSVKSLLITQLDHIALTICARLVCRGKQSVCNRVDEPPKTIHGSCDRLRIAGGNIGIGGVYFVYISSDRATPDTPTAGAPSSHGWSPPTPAGRPR
ncbi:hypothetical protein, partial [Streptomyces minutiscleroticus]|uniref:hypothetical protein n=1 Tax=Streptomyces minutiscleroticus TaxID=68238 RepID=UPI00331FE5B3